METLKFKIEIRAKREKVWQVLWNDETYRKWTSVFSEGSYAQSDWNQGSYINFLSSNGNGMFSVIEMKVPNQQMIFKHLGEIKNGNKELKDWSGALEKYFLSELDNITYLDVEVDINEEYKSYFTERFPKALEAVKQLSETD